MIYNFAKEYTDMPGGRYEKTGSHSGEDFRDNILIPMINKCIESEDILNLNLDGTLGYPVSFLDEVFGGIVRSKKFYNNDLKYFINIISTEEPKLALIIENSISEYGGRNIVDMKINEVMKFKNVNIKCVEDEANSCDKCYFAVDKIMCPILRTEFVGECTAEERLDKKAVKFIKVEMRYKMKDVNIVGDTAVICDDVIKLLPGPLKDTYIGKADDKEMYIYLIKRDRQVMYIQDEDGKETYCRLCNTAGGMFTHDIKDFDIVNLKDKDILTTLSGESITRINGVGHRIGGVIFEYDINCYIGDTKKWYHKTINPIGEVEG